MAPEDESTAGYGAAWGEIGAALEAGTSWSGHERDRAWRGDGAGGFTDVSAIWGLDRVEDGRVALRVDWDGDGDEDLWLRYRNGPTLRFLENRARGAAGETSVRVRAADGVLALEFDLAALEGDGAPAGLHTQRVPLRPVADGYLANVEANAAVTIRVASPDALQRVRVALRGGGALEPVALDARSGALDLVRDGDDWRLVPRTLRATPLDALAVGPLQAPALQTRVVLRTPLGLPTERVADLGGAAHGRLVIVKSADCEVCRAGLPAYLAEAEGRAVAPSVEITLESQSEARHGDFFATVAASILGPGAELALPLGFLLGEDGALHAFYTGALDADEVERDTAAFGRGGVRAAFRSAFGGGGRWFHGAPRSYGPLTRALREAGLVRDANVYTTNGASGR